MDTKFGLWASLLLILGLASLLAVSQISTPATGQMGLSQYGVYQSPAVQPAPAPRVMKDCTDTDAGKDYNKKGTVEVRIINGIYSEPQRYKITDSCILFPNQGSPTFKYIESCEQGQLCYVSENYCSDRGGKGYEIDKSYRCPTGCHDGACTIADVSPLTPPPKTESAKPTVTFSEPSIASNVGTCRGSCRAYSEERRERCTIGFTKGYFIWISGRKTTTCTINTDIPFCADALPSGRKCPPAQAGN